MAEELRLDEWTFWEHYESMIQQKDTKKQMKQQKKTIKKQNKQAKKDAKTWKHSRI